MPTIYTGSYKIPYYGGRIAGSNAQKIYNQEKAREDARFAAELNFKKQQLQAQKEESEANMLFNLDRIAQQRLQEENKYKMELIQKQQSREDSFKKYALDTANKSDFNIGTPEYEKILVDSYNQIKNFNSGVQPPTQENIPSIETSQGGAPQPPAVTDIESLRKKQKSLKEGTASWRYMQSKINKAEESETLKKDISNLADNISQTGTIASIKSDKYEIPLKNELAKRRKEAVKTGADRELITTSWAFDTNTKSLDDLSTEMINKQSIIENLQKIKDIYDEEDSRKAVLDTLNVDISPIVNKLKKINPFEENLKKATGMINQILAPLVRSEFGEKGNLSEFDIERGIKAVGDTSDPYEVRKFLIDMLITKISKNANLKLVTKSNYSNVSSMTKFYDFFDSLNKEKSSEKQSGLISQEELNSGKWEVIE